MEAERMGRPVKYMETRKPISLFVPETVLDNLDGLAEANKTTRTELINACLIDADHNEAVRLVQAYNDFAKALQDAAKSTEAQDKTIKSLQGRTMMSLYSEIEHDEKIDGIIEEFREEFLAEKERDQKRIMPFEMTVERWTDRLLGELEGRLFEDGKMIKNKAAVKRLVSAGLARLK
jgi:hypothetical protein